jgi:hypothetical protein
MIAEAATDLLFVGCALILALAIYLIMRARLVVVPNMLTRIFGILMSAHAFINLVTRNSADGQISWFATVVANITALIYLATYLNVLRRHQEGPILAALAFALGGSLAVFILAGSGTFQLSREIAAYAGGIAAFALFVLWRSARSRVTTAAPSVGVSR